MLGMVAGSIGIESSTLSMEWVRELHAAAAKQGVKLADAPVTGHKIAANEGDSNR